MTEQRTRYLLGGILSLPTGLMMAASVASILGLAWGTIGSGLGAINATDVWWLWPLMLTTVGIGGLVAFSGVDRSALAISALWLTIAIGDAVWNGRFTLLPFGAITTLLSVRLLRVR